METKQKLPVKFKEKWVAALRSGKYKQTEGHLYDLDNDGFCCIGVAANICGVSKDKLNNASLVNQTYDLEVYDIVKKTKKFPSMLYGHMNKFIELEYNPVVDKLADYNDGGKSFKWIASYIERWL
jgi:O-succinylbenzoate synthase